MIEIIEQYMPQIVTYLAFLAPVLPAFIRQHVTNKRIQNSFTEFKSSVGNMTDKVNNYVSLVKDLSPVVKDAIKEIGELKKIAEDIIPAIDEFKNSEELKEVVASLSKIAVIEESLKLKDETIGFLTTAIKDIKKEIYK